MWTYDYVGEKLRELDAELARRGPHRPALDARFTLRTPVRPRPTPRPVLAPLARVMGTALHRIGHRLQSWGTPPAVEGDAAWVVAALDPPGPPLGWSKEGC